ncbi:MAG: TatD family hydrolase [Candidatus Omnitrophota bacterium]|nr:TatD family hydrolase [Candidatus Omnitrophota bacterium]
MFFVDTHCHLDFPEFNLDRDEVIGRAKDQGIAYIINIGSSMESSKRSLVLSEQYDFIFPTVGIHPHEADNFNKDIEAEFFELAMQEKVKAIGEIGLDYFKNYSTCENQKVLFCSLIRLAKELSLPVVIHSRKAEPDILEILKKAMPIRAVVHCFSADEFFLKECLSLGFFISFTCNITYKKADNLRNLVKFTPIERLMLETDSPFLAPQEFRGRRNEPLYVKELAREIASIKAMELEEVAMITTDNAIRFFRLPHFVGKAL